MNVLQIGCGVMGTKLLRFLKEAPDVSQLTVCDTAFEENHKENGILFIHDFSCVDLGQYDCAFVATPATSHFEILCELIKNGIKKIFVEKPAVMNRDEFDAIQKIKGECDIAIGYILRQSKPLFTLKCILEKMENEGFILEMISIVYQKNFPYTGSAREETDIGVYEEIVHIWDLLFNYLEFDRAGVEQIKIRQKTDETRNYRVIFSQITYLLHMKKCETLVHITSSFHASKRKREFFFSYVNDSGERRHISYLFDTVDKIDCIVVKNGKGDVIYEEEYPSLNKLRHQVQEVFTYFKTSEPGSLAVFADETTILDLFDKIPVIE